MFLVFDSPFGEVVGLEKEAGRKSALFQHGFDFVKIRVRAQTANDGKRMQDNTTGA